MTARVVTGKGWAMHLGDCLDVLPTLERVDHVITDPPYGEHVHRSGIRLTPDGQKYKRRDIRALPDVTAQPCRASRSIDLGFESLLPGVRAACAGCFAYLARRWTLVFSDMEGADGWRSELTSHGLEFIRYGVWVKERSMPQISGDRPGNRVEQITIAHPKGRKRWNSGGLGNVWQHPIVANCNGHRSERVHTTQKPESLMLELVKLFTDPGETILDAFAGSGTTGVACLRLGRKFIGIERDERYFEIACKRIEQAVSQVQLFAQEPPKQEQVSLL